MTALRTRSIRTNQLILENRQICSIEYVGGNLYALNVVKQPERTRFTIYKITPELKFTLLSSFVRSFLYGHDLNHYWLRNQFNHLYIISEFNNSFKQFDDVDLFTGANATNTLRREYLPIFVEKVFRGKIYRIEDGQLSVDGEVKQMRRDPTIRFYPDLVVTQKALILCPTRGGILIVYYPENEFMNAEEIERQSEFLDQVFYHPKTLQTQKLMERLVKEEWKEEED